jgi:hypothetical protein
MSDKKRIEDLERRVRELEARPYWPPTIIIQPMRELTVPQPYYPPWQPWFPVQPFSEPPIWYVTTSTTGIVVS